MSHDVIFIIVPALNASGVITYFTTNCCPQLAGSEPGLSANDP